MQIFEIIGDVIYDTDKKDGYYNCKVVGGGYHIERGFHASVLPHGGEHEFEYRIENPETYDRILQAYLKNETIGVILQAF
jgi:hypothetical protein